MELRDLMTTSVMRRLCHLSGQSRSHLSNMYFHCNERCVKVAQPGHLSSIFGSSPRYTLTAQASSLQAYIRSQLLLLS